MLLVGCFLYGFGNWEAMVKDPKLGLDGKFYLEEGKKHDNEASALNKPIPNAIHLVRRGDFLLGLLREQQDKVRSYETSVRGKDIELRNRRARAASAIVSNAGQKVKQSASEMKECRGRGSADRHRLSPTRRHPMNGKVSLVEWVTADHNNGSSMDEASTKEELRPVKKQLVCT